MKPCLRAKGCLHPLWASPCSRPHLGGEVLWNQSFGSAGEGWDGPLRATHSRRAFPRWHQPLRTRVLREDPAHVPGTNSGFRVHVLQTWLGLGLGLGIGLSKDSSSSSGVVQAWWRAPRLGPSHPRRANSSPCCALGADGVGAARPGACGSPAAARGLLGRVPCVCQKTWGNHEI